MSEKRKNTYRCSKIPLHKNFKLILEQNVTEQAYPKISCRSQKCIQIRCDVQYLTVDQTTNFNDPEHD